MSKIAFFIFYQYFGIPLFVSELSFKVNFEYPTPNFEYRSVGNYGLKNKFVVTNRQKSKNVPDFKSVIAIIV